MSITLDLGVGGVLELPADLAWSDARTASTWSQDQDRTITGALVCDSFQSAAPTLTLSSGLTYGWATTAVVDALRARFEASDATMTLTIGSTSYTVLLDRPSGGFEASPLKVRPAEHRPGEDWWRVVLHFRLLEVL